MQAEVEAGLAVITGTPLNIDDVRNAFEESKPEDIIVTLSAPRAGDSPFATAVAPPRLMGDSTAKVVAVMKEFKTPKVVIMQAFGVGESWVNTHCVTKLLTKKSNMIYQYDDHNLVAKETQASGETYIFVRPSRLVEREAKDIRIPQPWQGCAGIGGNQSRQCCEVFSDVAESNSWDNTAPVITN